MNAIPVIGWLLSFIGNVSMAVPFWICWTACGIGERYFSFLPPEWMAVPFWDCVGIFISVSVIKQVFVPRLAKVDQTNNNKPDEKGK